jgi:hypothetical protein
MKDRRTFYKSKFFDQPTIQKPRKCIPICDSFRCSQRALEIRFQNNRKIAWCNYVPGGELCEGPNCNYAICLKHKLKSDNTCGLYTQPKKEIEVDDNTDYKDKWEKEVRVKDKVMKRFKDKLKY